jgi:hypothetical protein
MTQWLPAILLPFANTIVIVITYWWTTRALSAQIEALHAEMEQQISGIGKNPPGPPMGK